ncbi:MAG: hypothetical protein F4206_17045 [Gammaproteobacteria bacterium]|nr:hypothetical protein [Gammaproteobacteria bacterium]
MEEILDLIERRIKPGTVIPKPQGRGDFVVREWGARRGERALIYSTPNHGNPSRPHRKKITVSEWRMASSQLFRTGKFTRKWFQENMVDCYKRSCSRP